MTPLRWKSVRALSALAVLTLAACAGQAASPRARRPAAPHRPNIVFILTDDLSWNLINARFAPHIVALEHRGETFDHYFVADSLCCPSRASIFTGLFPHDTKVIANTGLNGGYQKFQSEHLYDRTFARSLQLSGYRTAMLGKYLNGYGDPAMRPAVSSVPVGWNDWHVSNASGYAEYRYVLNDNGVVNRYGGRAARGGPSGAPDAYGVDVVAGYAQRFIAGAHGRPFAVEAATFAPHQPYTPAQRNADDFPGLSEPRDPSFNAQNINPPAWLGPRPPLDAVQLAEADLAYRKRAQSVEAVDRLLARVEQTLAARHQLQNTYIVFSSDNGYHLAQHRLVRGKQTAFDTDIRVPLIVAGPGVPHGRTVSQVVQNVDLAPTFLALAGRRPSPRTDGRSLVPLLRPTAKPVPWRTAALVEHAHSGNPSDPDYEAGNAGGNPTTYSAVRVSAPHLPGFHGPIEAVYVEYRDPKHETEYYDLRRDRYELDNVAGRLRAAQRRALHRLLMGLERCRGATACWSAALPETR